MNHLKNEAKTMDQNQLKIDQTSTQNRSKNQPKIDPKSIKIDQTSTKDRGLEGSGASWEAYVAGLGDPRHLESHQWPFWRRLGGLLGGLRPRKVANMGPTWRPKRSKNQWKICLNIDQFHDASWNRCFSVFHWLLETKTEPCWIENVFKHRSYLKKA